MTLGTRVWISSWLTQRWPQSVDAVFSGLSCDISLWPCLVCKSWYLENSILQGPLPFYDIIGRLDYCSGSFPRLFLSAKPWVEALEMLSEMERRWGSGLSSPGAQNHDSFNWANWGTWPPEKNDMVRSLVTISCVWSHTFTCKWNYI